MTHVVSQVVQSVEVTVQFGGSCLSIGRERERDSELLIMEVFSRMNTAARTAGLVHLYNCINRSTPCLVLMS